jgi:hypothetical protein
MLADGDATGYQRRSQESPAIELVSAFKGILDHHLGL